MIVESQNKWFPDHKTCRFIFADAYVGEFKLSPEKNGVSIWSVYINSNYRGIGLGNEMMKECVEFIQQNYPKGFLVFLWVEVGNIPAIKSYENAGFRFSQVFHNENSTVRKMEMRL